MKQRMVTICVFDWSMRRFPYLRSSQQIGRQLVVRRNSVRELLRGKKNITFCLFIVLFCAGFVSAQVVQFNANGDLVRIWNLKKYRDSPKCGAKRTFVGEIIDVINYDSDNQSGFEFVLKLATGKKQKIKGFFTWGGKVKFDDVNRLLQNRRRLFVVARRCGDYFAEDIRRL